MVESDHFSLRCVAGNGWAGHIFATSSRFKFNITYIVTIFLYIFGRFSFGSFGTSFGVFATKCGWPQCII